MAKRESKDKIKLGRLEYLASDRTILANERTYLAYVRTALTLFVAGASFLQFFEARILHYVGWGFMPLGVLVFAVGQYKYFRVRNIVSILRSDIEEEDPSLPPRDEE